MAHLVDEMNDLEIARQVARQPINPADFKAIPPERHGLDADWPGPNPRRSFAPGERQAFEAVRDRLDTVLQITGVRPSFPQEHLTPTAYEGLLLTAVAHATPGSGLRADSGVEGLARTGYLARHHGARIVSEAMESPRRQGRLAPVKKIDGSGRQITEYVGSARAWMQPFLAPAQVNEGGILCVPNADGSVDDASVRRFLPTVV